MEQTQEEIEEVKKRIRQQEIEFYGDHELDLKEFDFNYDSSDGEYELDVLQQEMMQFYIRNDPKFRQAYYTDYTGLFIRVLKDKARLREPVHISIMGTVRGGKSYGGISILAIMMALQGKLVLPIHICPNAYKFLERIQEMPLEETNNTCFLRDEDKGASFGIGSLSKKAKITDIANIIAKHNISTLSLCPIKFSDSESHYGLRVLGRNFKTKTTKFLLYNMMESKSTMTPMGVVILPIFTKLLPEWYHKPLEKAYIKMKDDWIADEIEGKGQDVLADLKKKTAEKFIRDPQFMGLTNKKQRKIYIQQVMGSEWTIGEIDTILGLTEMMRNGITFNEEPPNRIEKV